MRKFIIGFKFRLIDWLYLHKNRYFTYKKNNANIFTDKREGDIAIYRLLTNHYWDEDKTLVLVEECE